MHVELGMRTKHVVNGFGIVPFLIDSRGILGVMDVLWVPEMRRSVLLVLWNEEKGFEVVF
jgi:hypothetical protein